MVRNKVRTVRWKTFLIPWPLSINDAFISMYEFLKESRKWNKLSKEIVIHWMLRLYFSDHPQKPWNNLQRKREVRRDRDGHHQTAERFFHSSCHSKPHHNGPWARTTAVCVCVWGIIIYLSLPKQDMCYLYRPVDNSTANLQKAVHPRPIVQLHSGSPLCSARLRPAVQHGE